MPPFRQPPPDRPKSRSLGVLRALGPYLRPHRTRIALAAVALLVGASAVLLIGQGVRVLVDQGFSAGNPALLNTSLAALVALIVVMSTASFLRIYMVTSIGERVVADLRRAVFDRLMALDMGFYEVTPTGEVLSRLTTDTTQIQSVVGSTVSFALRNLLTFIGGVVLMVLTAPGLALLTLLVIPVVLVLVLGLGRRVRKLSRASQDRVADLSAHAGEVLGAMATVQAFVHESWDRKAFAVDAGAARDAALRLARVRALLIAAVMALVLGVLGLVLWQGGHRVLEGSMSAGDLTGFVYYAMVAGSGAAALSEVMGELQRAAGAMERLLELLATTPKVTVPDRPKPLPSPGEGAVRLDNVTFRYPARPDMAALDRVTLDVAPGERVALVGPSGAGKTTVFRLLLRFHDPDQGRILLDGMDVREADPMALRRRFALVPQDPVIFSGSVRDNIRYGLPEADDEHVRAAAEAAAAWPFIQGWPDGLDTQVGERGMRLSGGQAQRLVIARALLMDPQVLLLDEATSALDSENERLVQGALDRLLAGRTSLVIAHRLATVVNADRIVVLDQGQVVAQGTHETLMTASPLYARQAELQFGLTLEAG